MRKFTFFLFLFLVNLSVSSYGQEVLLDLQSYPVKEVKFKKSSALAGTKSLLGLPFFDDFSNGLSYPDPNNWSDSFVLINQTYAIDPPTIGVATFDAINQYGKLYSSLSTSSSIADVLTSLPIDLKGDSIYFSFQYEPKGLGKEPQTTDSLVLEFLSVDSNNWTRVWSASANFTNNTIKEYFHLTKNVVTQKATKISDKFFKVIFPINDERFLKAGFRFRFINYASFSDNSQIPSVRGNGDQWHLDLVYLDSSRFLTDTILDDVTFSKPIKSFLKNYESIPWKHFNSDAQLAELPNPLTFKMQYTNLGPITWNVTRWFVVTDLSSNLTPSYAFSSGSDNIYAYQTINAPRTYEYTFSSNWEDSAKFHMESYLDLYNTKKTVSNTYPLRWNDTVRYTQKFINYYAYDDGSAENGYGLFGEGSQDGMVALKYHSYVEDSLKGILIYFNQIYDDNSKPNFKLTVWSDNNGKPGSILYQKTTLKPVLAYNRDTLYRIDDPLKIGGDFWIGTINTTTDMLNIGFDLNNVHNDKLYYNLAGSWVKSSFEGSLMIKPVFGKFAKGQTGIIKHGSSTDFSIFPNPTSNQVNLNIPDNSKPQRIRIVNLAGQVVLNKTFDSNSIDVSNLPTGIYLIQLTFNNRTATTKKLVIIK